MCHCGLHQLPQASGEVAWSARNDHSQGIIRRFTGYHCQCGRGDAWRAAHAAAAAHEHGSSGSQEGCHTVNGDAHHPAMVGGPIHERESAIDQLAPDRGGRFVDRDINDGADSRGVETARIGTIAGVSDPKEVRGDLAHGRLR